MGSGVSSQGSPIDSKTTGDIYFNNKDFEQAIIWYSKSINELKIGVHDRAVLYSNRSAAFLSNLQPQAALVDADIAIELEPSWCKAYFRAAKACTSLGKYHDALAYICKAESLSTIVDGSISELKLSIESLVENALPSQTSLYVWGNGQNGQLGLGLAKLSSQAACQLTFFSGKKVVDVSCGFSHSVSILNSGDIYVWGDNEHRQLGLPTLESRYLSVPTLLPGLIGVRLVAVSCGAGHTIALTDMGKLYAWGIGKQGQLGLGRSLNESCNVPTLIASLAHEPVQSVACGIAHSVFLTRDGVLFGCGLNSSGQLGLGTSQSEPNIHEPMPISLMSDCNDNKSAEEVKHIACGGAHTMVIASEQRGLWVTGSNSCGQLGIGGDFTDQDGFVKINNFSNCVFCACGEEYSGLVTMDRSVYMWGLGLAGQLGNGKFCNDSGVDSMQQGCSFHQDTPQKVEGLAGLAVTEIMCSQTQVLALTQGGEVYCWGLSATHSNHCMLPLGASSATEDCRPHKSQVLPRNKKILQIACGRKHFIVRVASASAMNSYISRAIVATARENDEDGKSQDGYHTQLYVICAGQKFSFIVQAVDDTNSSYQSGGCIIDCKVRASTLDHEIKLRTQLKDEKTRLQNGIVMDDNLDGSYTGSGVLYLTGHYGVSVCMTGQDVGGSPFELLVEAGRVCAQRCVVWWSNPSKFFTDPSSVEIEGLSSMPSSDCTTLGKLFGCCGETIVLTVSARDSWGNNCCLSEKQEPLAVRVTLIMDPTAAGDVTCTHTLWSKHCRGVFAAVIVCPSHSCRCQVVLQIGALEDMEQRPSPALLSLAKIPDLLCDPLTLTVRTRPVITPHTAVQHHQANIDEIQDSELVSEVERAREQTEEVQREEVVACMTGQEVTNMRAALALRKMRADCARAKEAKIRSKAARRTGGGFIIQYSKDV